MQFINYAIETGYTVFIKTQQGITIYIPVISDTKTENPDPGMFIANVMLIIY